MSEEKFNHEKFIKERKLKSRILIENWSGDLHIEILGTPDDHIKSFVGFLLQYPEAGRVMMEATKIAMQMMNDPEFMKGLDDNTIMTQREVKEEKK